MKDKDKCSKQIKKTVLGIILSRLIFPLRGESHRFSYAVCYNDANKMTPCPCHIRHSQNFDKIYSFLKPDLDIFILHNFILWWGRGLLKKGLVFCIRSIDLGKILIVRGSSIHQSKSQYYLGPLQTFGTFCEHCFWL